VHEKEEVCRSKEVRKKRPLCSPQGKQPDMMHLCLTRPEKKRSNSKSKIGNKVGEKKCLALPLFPGEGHSDFMQRRDTCNVGEKEWKGYIWHRKGGGGGPLLLRKKGCHWTEGFEEKGENHSIWTVEKDSS